MTKSKHQIILRERKKSLPYVIRAFGFLVVLVLIAQSSFGQRARSNRIHTDGFAPKANDYAYETEATTKKKVRQKGQSGNPRYQVDKPRQATEFTPNDRTYDYAKPPYFGHKKPVVKRPPGQQKLCKICGIRH